MLWSWDIIAKNLNSSSLIFWNALWVKLKFWDKDLLMTLKWSKMSVKHFHETNLRIYWSEGDGEDGQTWYMQSWTPCQAAMVEGH